MPLLFNLCGWRDSNSQGKATRPSNVRVYQFRHIRAITYSIKKCAAHILTCLSSHGQITSTRSF